MQLEHLMAGLRDPLLVLAAEISEALKRLSPGARIRCPILSGTVSMAVLLSARRSSYRGIMQVNTAEARPGSAGSLSQSTAVPWPLAIDTASR